MTHSYHEIAFTPGIRNLQSDAGSREGYASMGGPERYNHLLTAREAEFIAQRDSFYMASVSESGWPYVQHRGGPAGFMKVLDERSLGFADYSGNRQYLSTGNLINDDRVSLFFMDYPNRRRLKMMGRARVVDAAEADVLAKLEDSDYPAQIERAFLITVEGFDWNCPAHITPRFTEADVRSSIAELLEENRRLKALQAEDAGARATHNTEDVLGDGPLELVISGMRQLAPNVRAFELRHSAGEDLPEVSAGSHLRVPVRLPGGELTERHYSIASNPARRDAWEIAVLRDDRGSGGSVAVHDSYRIGTTLRVNPPENHFPLHTDRRHAVLIAGGIGITPIKAMAQALENRGASFELHYAGRARNEMAYRDRLERQLGERLEVYNTAEDKRMDVEALLAAAPADAVIYVCGPDRLVSAVLATAKNTGIPRERVRMELFN